MNEWINVRDRLPNTSDDVWVFDGLAQYEGFYQNGDWWYTGGSQFPVEVTHWQPLPPPPE